MIDQFADKSPPQQLTPIQAFERLKQVANGPTTEMNLGWAYIPFSLSILLQNTERWVGNENAVALIYLHEDRILNREFPDKDGIFLIMYGNAEGIQDLVTRLIPQLRKQGIKEYSIFCPEPITAAVEQLGFGNYDDGAHSVVLFEKEL